MPEIDPVIQTIIAEALGEGPEGMRLVGETIVNRAEQRGLPPERVVTQPYQYTGYSNPGAAAVKAFNDPEVISAAQAAWNLAKGAGDPTGGANHYYAPGTISQPGWAKGMTNTLTHGGHAFYTDRPYQQKGLGPVAVNPAQITPTTAALRQMTSPTNGNTALQTALNQYAANKATALKNQVTPQIPPWASMNMNQGKAPVQSGSLSAAQKNAANMAALKMNQSYVGQNSYAPKLPANATTAQKAEAARRAALSMGGNFTYAGNQGVKPLSQMQLPPGQTGMPALYGSFSPNQVNAMGIPVNGKAPTQNTIKGGYAPTPFPKPNFGPVAPVPFNKPNFASKTAPVPYSKPNFGKVAPVPFDKPNFGMGGPGFAPVNAAAMVQMQGNIAPQPMIPPWASMQMNQPPMVPRPVLMGSNGMGSISSMGGGPANMSALRPGQTGGRRY